jgi:hypothetical protein
MVTEPTASTTTVTTELPNDDERVRRARAYLAKLPPAIEGNGGDRQTHAATCYLVREFAPDVAAALPLLKEYNARCVRAPNARGMDFAHPERPRLTPPRLRF